MSGRGEKASELLLTKMSLLREQNRGVKEIRLRGQAVKTSPFHGGNTGSIPVGVIERNIS